MTCYGLLDSLYYCGLVVLLCRESTQHYKQITTNFTGQVITYCLHATEKGEEKSDPYIIIIIIISNLSNDRSKASSKTIPPHSAI